MIELAQSFLPGKKQKPDPEPEVIVVNAEEWEMKKALGDMYEACTKLYPMYLDGIRRWWEYSDPRDSYKLIRLPLREIPGNGPHQLGLCTVCYYPDDVRYHLVHNGQELGWAGNCYDYALVTVERYKKLYLESFPDTKFLPF